ncbi:MAG: sugar phosphate isomerase/epimerase [Treponema sp.]|jgi:sugar phosphate isomerase/epimerase|nr:sugar phosphate isomerase/epimerase [Treponema sp.]
MKVGIQLFSLRNHMAENPIAAIQTVVKEGYRFLEAANHNATQDSGVGFGVEAREIKKVLNDTGAAMISAHISPLNDDTIGPVLEYHQELGTKYLVVPAYFYDSREDALKKTELLNKLGQACAQANMSLVYHNHFHEFQLFAGQTVFSILMQNTDPALVGIELDTYWAMRGGNDPVALLRQYGERVRLIHQKDYPAAYKDKINLIDVVNEKGLRVDMNYMMGIMDAKTFTEVGTGIMDIQDIITVGNDVCKTDYIILEQDFSSRDELESIRISMDSFKKFPGIQW